MAKPKLTRDQRDILLQWAAAEYSYDLIAHWFKERGWEPIAHQSYSYYRQRYADEIEAARKQRRSEAMTTGLALKEERVARLQQHADELKAVMWQDTRYEKAYREIMEQIAKEVGDRKDNVIPSEITFRFVPHEPSDD